MVKPYTEDTTFATVVDTENVLANMFGFKVVPNGIFVDKEGVIRLIKQGFHVTKEEHVKAVTELLNGLVEKIVLEDEYYQPSSVVPPLEKQLSETKFKLGMEYARIGKKEEALKELDEALLLDTDNFLIRKQRWYIQYPEKFSPSIDVEWQQAQLNKEREEEARRNELSCGPDGCKIPGTC